MPFIRLLRIVSEGSITTSLLIVRKLRSSQHIAGFFSPRRRGTITQRYPSVSLCETTNFQVAFGGSSARFRQRRTTNRERRLPNLAGIWTIGTLKISLSSFLILFAPHAFVSQRQGRPSWMPSLLGFRSISTDFTPTPTVLPAPSAL